MRARIALAVLAAAVVAAPAASAPSPAGDMRELYAALRTIHPNPHYNVTRAQYQAAVRRAAARAPKLTPNELVVELMRLVTLLGPRNGHSGIVPSDTQHRRPLHLYPIRLYTFADGTFVVDAEDDSLIGAQVVAIAGRPFADVLRLVRPLVGRDNETGRKGYLPHYALCAEVLDGVGVAGGTGTRMFKFARGGSTFERELAPVGAATYTGRFADPQHGHYPSALPAASRPLYLANAHRQLWLTRLAAGRVLYVGYNNTFAETSQFSQRLERAARSPSVKAVVIDLRLNGGGNNQSYYYLLDVLKKPFVNQRGKLFVLIGRATFSAAGNFAADVEQYTRATFVGEPTGGGVKQFGDSTAVTLPYTGLNVYIASEWVERGRPNDRRLAVAPDVPMALTSRDYFARRDPALAYVVKRATR